MFRHDFRMPSITSTGASKWSSQRSGVLVNLYYIIELLLFDENGMKRSCAAVVYIAVCSLWKHCSKGLQYFCSMFS